MGKTLVIAEKPSVAVDIARALGGCPKQGDHFEGDTYVITSAVGHLLEMVPPPEAEVARGKWRLENLPCLPDHFDLVPAHKAEDRLRLIKKLAKRKDITQIINACDAGREGELIFRNVIRATGASQPLRRLWLQSMTAEAIRTAFKELREDAEMLPLADAAVSRSEADWLIGINATRALTAFNSRDGGFHKTTAGRVQTPTLAILVEREQRIRDFVPRTYFEVFGDFAVQSGEYRGRWFDETFKKDADEDRRPERIWERERAEAIKARCQGRPGQIVEEKKPATQLPPLLYDLTTLQREANSRFGFPARVTLQIAQALYERHKVLTYPRTDSRHLPEDYLRNCRQIMESFPARELAPFAEKALGEGWVRPNRRIFNNAKVSDHFAIIPTGTEPKHLDEREAKLFGLVARRFVAVFYPAAQFEVTTRITRVERDAFKTEGRVIVDPGWLAVYGREAEGEDSEKSIAPIRPGEKVADTRAVEVKETQTKPPARFTEATLLSAMEGAGKLVEDEELREAMSERGLGTPATRAQVIEGLLAESYIERRGRDLAATEKGISLITLLVNLQAETLTHPSMTGDWEFKLKRMERAQLSREEFMREIRQLTADIVGKVKQFKGEIQGNFRPLDVPCPKCGRQPVDETFKSFRCGGCGLTVWKTMAGREFERDEVSALLRDKRVGPVEGFRSRRGIKFAAVVVLDEEGKQKFEFEKNGEGEDSAAAPVWANPEPVGPCRVCGQGQVYETASSYQCENHFKKTCAFRMGHLILERDIPREQVGKLLQSGKTDLLDRFVSRKTRRAFKAFLKLEESGKVGFEFQPREARRGAKPGKTKKPQADQA